MKGKNVPIISYVVLVVAIIFGSEQDNGFVKSKLKKGCSNYFFVWASTV